MRAGLSGSPETGPGTYVLLLRCSNATEVRVGRLGDLHLGRGWYLYVGSAFGPGGVAARCDHHRRFATRPHWHIDYLRAGLPLREIWFTHDPLHREHQWAALLASAWALPSPFEGFGASDCDCRSHLFHSAVKPDVAEFRDLIQQELVGHASLYCEIV